MKLLVQWKNQLIKYKPVTPTCKICFEDIKQYNLYNILGKKPILCQKCMNSLVPIFERFKIGKIHALSIYKYDEKIKSLLFQLKGCYDIELADVFLVRYIKEIKEMFNGYIVIPAPSYYIDDQRRGFNHVEEIYKGLKLHVCKAVTKIDEYKQSDQKKIDRINISKHLKLSLLENLQNKKILIVDDVYTTGHTINAIIELIEPLKPKKIDVLVLAKTIQK